MCPYFISLRSWCFLLSLIFMTIIMSWNNIHNLAVSLYLVHNSHTHQFSCSDQVVWIEPKIINIIVICIFISVVSVFLYQWYLSLVTNWLQDSTNLFILLLSTVPTLKSEFDSSIFFARDILTFHSTPMMISTTVIFCIIYWVFIVLYSEMASLILSHISSHSNFFGSSPGVPSMMRTTVTFLFHKPIINASCASGILVNMAVF